MSGLDYDVIDKSDGAVLMRVRHLWPGDPVDCCMCEKPTHSRMCVPYYCGPVLEEQSEGGYKTACEPCYARWEAWSDKHATAKATGGTAP